ncbi:MAG: viperin family antiviral radical SAM protein [Thalassospira sp.]|uniref:viperin family antiviral radical SAM protein n=1 Tax=Thalassospira sp. TaxID=1912094 RepID=UPI0032F00679
MFSSGFPVKTEGAPRMKYPNANILQTDELVVNWHITEACNYRCQYCYAHWEKAETRPELWKSETHSVALLKELYRFFSPEHQANPLRRYLTWRSLRLSIAGGEPTLLGERFLAIVNHARELGFRISVITNASRPDVIAKVAPKIDMLGVSVDSDVASINSTIGRECRKGTQVSRSDIAQMVEQARLGNPQITIKLNTVVCAENISNDLSGLIREIGPDRWKIMRMLPVTTAQMSVTKKQFSQFVLRHQGVSVRQTIEDNSDMEQSYVMVDPKGRFFQNEVGGFGYKYSECIPTVGADQAFSQIAFCPATFSKRYADLVPEVGAK